MTILTKLIVLLFCVLNTTGGKGPGEATFSLQQQIHELAEDYVSNANKEPLEVSPNGLAFPPSQLFIASRKNVEIINHGHETITLIPVRCNISAFQASKKEVDLPPKHLVKIPIMFLPTKLGRVEAKIAFETSLGKRVEVRLRGTGIANDYRIRSLRNITVSVGMQITTPISIYNPNKNAYVVKEMFTSEKFFHLGLPPQTSKSQERSPIKFWEIQPMESKRVIDLKFKSKLPGIYFGYVYLRSQDHMMIIPIRVRVLEKSFVFVFHPTKLDFGKSTKKSQVRPQIVHVKNLGREPLELQEFIHEQTEGEASVSTDLVKGTLIPPQGQKDIKLSLIMNSDRSLSRGMIRILTNQTNFTIPYEASSLFGRLEYSREAVLFRMPPIQQFKKEEPCANGILESILSVTNKFPTAIKILDLSVNHRSFSIIADKNLKAVAYRPGAKWKLCKIHFKAHPKDLEVSHITAELRIKSNISTFSLTLQAFDGSFQIFDGTQDKSSPLYVSGDSKETSPIKAAVRTLAIGRPSVFKLVNPNPVDLEITGMKLTPVPKMKSKSTSDRIKMSIGAKESGGKIILPAQSTVKLFLNATSTDTAEEKTSRITLEADIPMLRKHECAFAGRSTRIVFPIRYVAIEGSLEWQPGEIILAPYQAGVKSSSINVTNRYNTKMRVFSAKVCKENVSSDSCVEDETFTLKLNSKTLTPMGKAKIGEILFDPAKGGSDELYQPPQNPTSKYPSKKEIERVDRISEILGKGGPKILERFLKINVDILGEVTVPIKVSLVRPKILLDSTLDFGAVQINTSRTLSFPVVNPSKLTMKLSLCSLAQSSFSHSFSSTAKQMLPGQAIEVPVEFQPRDSGAFEEVLYIRNNITHLSRLTLTGTSTNQSMFFDMVAEKKESDSREYEPSDEPRSGFLQPVEQGGYVFHRMSLIPSSQFHHDDPKRHYWRLSMFNKGPNEVFVTGLSVGNFFCDTHDSLDSICKHFPLTITSGGSASIRVPTNAYEERSQHLSNSGLSSFVFPFAEHRLIVNTSAGDHRILLRVPLGWPVTQIGQMVGLVSQPSRLIETCVAIFVVVVLLFRQARRTRQQLIEKVTKVDRHLSDVAEEVETKDGAEPEPVVVNDVPTPAKSRRKKSKDGNKLKKVQEKRDGKEKSRAKVGLAEEDAGKENHVEQVTKDESQSKREDARLPEKHSKRKRRKSRDKRKEIEKAEQKKGLQNVPPTSSPADTAKPTVIQMASKTLRSGLSEKHHEKAGVDIDEKDVVVPKKPSEPKAAKKEPLAVKSPGQSSNSTYVPVNPTKSKSAASSSSNTNDSPARQVSNKRGSKGTRGRTPASPARGPNAHGRSKSRSRGATGSKKESQTPERRGKHSRGSKSKGRSDGVRHHTQNANKSSIGHSQNDQKPQQSKFDRHSRRWGEKKGHPPLSPSLPSGKAPVDQLSGRDTRLPPNSGSPSMGPVGPSSLNGNPVSLSSPFSPTLIGQPTHNIFRSSPGGTPHRNSNESAKPPSPLPMPQRHILSQGGNFQDPNVICQPRLGGLGSLGLHGLGNRGLGNHPLGFTTNGRQRYQPPYFQQPNLPEGGSALPPVHQNWPVGQGTRSQPMQSTGGSIGEGSSFFGPRWNSNRGMGPHLNLNPADPIGDDTRQSGNVPSTGLRLWNSKPLWVPQNSSGGGDASKWNSEAQIPKSNCDPTESKGTFQPAEQRSFFDFLDSPIVPPADKFDSTD